MPKGKHPAVIKKVGREIRRSICSRSPLLRRVDQLLQSVAQFHPETPRPEVSRSARFPACLKMRAILVAERRWASIRTSSFQFHHRKSSRAARSGAFFRLTHIRAPLMRTPVDFLACDHHAHQASRALASGQFEKKFDACNVSTDEAPLFPMRPAATSRSERFQQDVHVLRVLHRGFRVHRRHPR